MFLFLRIYGFLFILPTIAATISLLLRTTAGDFWQYADPTYLYLFNALHMVKGLDPTYIDNPGTTLQMFMLFVIRLINLGQSAEETLRRVLSNPEFYLQTIYSSLVLCSMLSSVFLGGYVYKKTNDKIAAVLSQLPWLSFFFLRACESNFPFLPVITNLGAESFLVVIINLFNLAFLKLYFSESSREKLWATIFLSIICGLGFATKLTFLPLIISAFLIVPWKAKFTFIVVFILSFILGTISAIHKYHVLFNYIGNYAFHTGHYGLGPKGMINWSEFLEGSKLIIYNYWFFVLSTFLALLWSTIKIIKNPKNLSIRFLWVAALGSLLQYLLTAKHFAFHYLLPGLGIFSCIFVIFYLQRLKTNVLLKRLTILFIFLFLSFCVVQHLMYRTKMLKLSNDIHNFNFQIHSKYPDAIIIPASTISSNIYLTAKHGLFLGNYASVHKEDAELARLYPNSYYFNSERTEPREREDGYGIRDFYGNRIFTDDLLRTTSPVIFIKLGSDFPEYAFNVHLIDKSKYLSAYLLVGTTEREAFNLFLLSEDLFNKGRYADAFALALKSRALNFEPKGKLEYLISMIYNQLKRH